MQPGELVEAAVRWASEPPRDARLARARAAFERRTGAIDSEQPDYEARISHFLDGFLCSYREDGDPPPVVGFEAATPTLDAEERALLAGLLRSQRALFRVECVAPRVRVVDLLGGAVFELDDVDPGSLSDGEVFDGRVFAHRGRLGLSPGRVFHPAHTHESLLRLLHEERVLALERERLLDALLAMLDRLHRFTRVRPEHLYTAEAIGSEGLSATWTLSTRPPTTS